MDEDEVLTKEEISKLLKVTERTIDKMRDKGMPYFKVGTNIRFRKEKVLKWLEDCTKK